MNIRPSLVDRSILTSPPQVYSIDNGMPKGLSITATTTSNPQILTTRPPVRPSQQQSKKGIFLNIFLVLILGSIGFFLWRKSKTYKPPPEEVLTVTNQEIKPINY